MDRLEQIEKLRERAKVTYDEARAAYDAANGDLLEAMIILEKQGKVQPPHGGGVYSTAGQQSSEGRDYQNSEGSKQNYKQEGKDGSAADNFMKTLERIGKFCAQLIQRGNNTTFEVLKDNESKAKFPVTVLALLVIFAPHITIPLIVIGLFFGFHYRFVGEGFSDLL